jgi:hypothetical protein
MEARAAARHFDRWLAAHGLRRADLAHGDLVIDVVCFRDRITRHRSRVRPAVLRRAAVPGPATPPAQG